MSKRDTQPHPPLLHISPAAGGLRDLTLSAVRHLARVTCARMEQGSWKHTTGVVDDREEVQYRVQLSLSMQISIMWSSRQPGINENEMTSWRQKAHDSWIRRFQISHFWMPWIWLTRTWKALVSLFLSPLWLFICISWDDGMQTNPLRQRVGRSEEK